MIAVNTFAKKISVSSKSLEVEAMIQAFVEWAWRGGEYASTIVTGCETEFAAHFWRRLCENIGTRPRLSTAFHIESDGQRNRQVVCKATLEGLRKGKLTRQVRTRRTSSVYLLTA